MMQFDVHQHPVEALRSSTPFVIVLQSDLIDHAESTIVAPLARAARIRHESRLFPALKINRHMLVMITTDLASIRRGLLGPSIANLEQERRRIIAAIDVLFTGV